MQIKIKGLVVSTEWQLVFRKILIDFLKFFKVFDEHFLDELLI